MRLPKQTCCLRHSFPDSAFLQIQATTPEPRFQLTTHCGAGQSATHRAACHAMVQWLANLSSDGAHRDCAGEHLDTATVAQTSKSAVAPRAVHFLYCAVFAGFQTRTAHKLRRSADLEVGDTADWKSALQVGLRASSRSSVKMRTLRRVMSGSRISSASGAKQQTRKWHRKASVVQKHNLRQPT
jgi:hypothetical protein